MITKNHTRPAILVVEDVAETRDGMEKLLKADGYHVEVARDERDAILSARSRHPDLILLSLAGLLSDVVVTVHRIRSRAEITDVPVVVLCMEGVGEGDEIAIGQNVHITQPDNFNQLRRLLTRLLAEISAAA